MSYYPTLDEDLARAKEILVKGHLQVQKLEGLEGPLRIRLDGGSISGGDIYAAYKLLESFVAEIESLRKANAELERESDDCEKGWAESITANRAAVAEIERLRKRPTVSQQTHQNTTGIAVTTARTTMNEQDRRSIDNIPEFSEGGGVTEFDHMEARYNRLKAQEQARHGSAMFATGVIEGLRQAIYAIQTNRDETQPSRNWPGMNAAIAAVERAITKAQSDQRSKEIR